MNDGRWQMKDPNLFKADIRSNNFDKAMAMLAIIVAQYIHTTTVSIVSEVVAMLPQVPGLSLNIDDIVTQIEIRVAKNKKVEESFGQLKRQIETAAEAIPSLQESQTKSVIAQSEVISQHNSKRPEQIRATPSAHNQEALTGLVELWADIFSQEIYNFDGKELTTYKLKPYITAALKDPGSLLNNFAESYPELAMGCTVYKELPSELRPAILLLCGKEMKYNLICYEKILALAAIVNMVIGITFDEFEQRFNKSFKCELTRITLDELLSKPRESNLHTLLEALPLFPGSIAGADRRLKSVLVSRRNELSEMTTYYEQDLKIALWDCWNGSHIDECLKILRQQGDIRQQMATLQRIMDGQEPELLRIMMLSMLRTAIEDLPDIHQDLRKLETQGREIPLAEEVLATVPSRHDDLVEPSPADLLEHIGISRDNTSKAEWQVFMMFSQKVLDGELEVGSKTGLSISAALGKDAPRVRKIISRYRERQLNC